MTETIYNWNNKGRKKKKIQLPGRRDEHEVELPGQLTITDRGLVPNQIPMYETPGKTATISRGFLDYDPLEDF